METCLPLWMPVDTCSLMNSTRDVRCLHAGDEAAPQGQREWPLREGACEVLGRSPLCLGKTIAHCNLLLATILTLPSCAQAARSTHFLCARFAHARCASHCAFSSCAQKAFCMLSCLFSVFNPSVVSETFPLAHSVRASCMKHSLLCLRMAAQHL